LPKNKQRVAVISNKLSKPQILPATPTRWQDFRYPAQDFSDLGTDYRRGDAAGPWIFNHGSHGEYAQYGIRRFAAFNVNIFIKRDYFSDY